MCRSVPHGDFWIIQVLKQEWCDSDIHFRP